VGAKSREEQGTKPANRHCENITEGKKREGMIAQKVVLKSKNKQTKGEANCWGQYLYLNQEPPQVDAHGGRANTGEKIEKSKNELSKSGQNEEDRSNKTLYRKFKPPRPGEKG